MPDRVLPTVQRAIEATAGPPDQHGWIQAVVPIEDIEHAQREFLGLGTDVEMLSPQILRRRIPDTQSARTHGDPGMPS